MGIMELLQDKREEILRVAARRGARRVRVFGSVARGQATPDSDVDFLVELEPGRSLFDLGGLRADLESLLQRPVDLAEVDGLSLYVKEQVLAEAVPL